MRDEMFDRDYQRGRAELAGLDRLFASAGRGLSVLHRIQWSAPWDSKPMGGR
jgi:hypothetical protein